MPKAEPPIKLVLVTGVSGAGHSTALKILEDYGYAAVDNLPLALVDPLIALEVETLDAFINCQHFFEVGEALVSYQVVGEVEAGEVESVWKSVGAG